MNVNLLYYVNERGAFPQYTLDEKFNCSFPKIALTWISRQSEYAEVSDVFEYAKDLVHKIHPECKDYLVVDFEEIP